MMVSLLKGWLWLFVLGWPVTIWYHFIVAFIIEVGKAIWQFVYLCSLSLLRLIDTRMIIKLLLEVEVQMCFYVRNKCIIIRLLLIDSLHVKWAINYAHIGKVEVILLIWEAKEIVSYIWAIQNRVKVLVLNSTFAFANIGTLPHCIHVWVDFVSHSGECTSNNI